MKNAILIATLCLAACATTPKENSAASTALVGDRQPATTFQNSPSQLMGQSYNLDNSYVTQNFWKTVDLKENIVCYWVAPTMTAAGSAVSCLKRDQK